MAIWNEPGAKIYNLDTGRLLIELEIWNVISDISPHKVEFTWSLASASSWDMVKPGVDLLETIIFLYKNNSFTSKYKLATTVYYITITVN